MNHLDYESRSRGDLAAIGLANYARHPSTEALCASYTVDGKMQRWRRGMPAPSALIDAVKNKKRVAGWNVPFECAIWNHTLRWSDHVPLDETRVFDTMAFGRYFGIPGKLSDASDRLQLGEAGKSKEGHKLMLKMCKPDSTGCYVEDREKLDALEDYCDRDVEAEELILHKIAKKGWGEWPASEQKLWEVDFRINQRGIPVDVDMCVGAMKIVNDIGERVLEKLPKLTHGAVATPNQTAAMRSWLALRGCKLPNMQKDTIDDALREELPDDVREVLECRVIGAPAAVKKYQAALDRQCDGRIFNSFVYYGAATGRWSSHGFQTQNMVRGMEGGVPQYVIDAVQMGDTDTLAAVADDMITLLQQAVRQAIAARPGHKLITSDWSAIEARIVPWVADHKPGVEMFHAFDAGRGPEPYRVVAGWIYGVRADEIGKGDKRTCGKVGVLGCGYGAGAEKIMIMAETMYGLKISLQLAEQIVARWRKQNAKVVKFWYALMNAFQAVFRGRAEVQVGPYIKYIRLNNNSIACQLPSGRRIFYHDVHVVDSKSGRQDLCYRRPDGTIRSVWHGLLMENICQAIARDCLADVLVEFDRIGLPVVHHAHDELTLEVRDDELNDAMQTMKTTMCRSPQWGPTLPLVTQPDYGQRYKK